MPLKHFRAGRRTTASNRNLAEWGIDLLQEKPPNVGRSALTPHWRVAIAVDSVPGSLTERRVMEKLPLRKRR